jgi:hypothetical protein
LRGRTTESPAAGRLDAQALAGSELASALGREFSSIKRVAARRAIGTAGMPAGCV